MCLTPMAPRRPFPKEPFPLERCHGPCQVGRRLRVNLRASTDRSMAAGSITQLKAPGCVCIPGLALSLCVVQV